MSKRKMTIMINVDEEERVYVTIKDKETGYSNTTEVMYSPDEHPDFNDWIGDEIYSWIDIMMGEIENNKESEDEE